MSVPKSIEASLWGNVTMWTGFLVLYTGQIFGQAFRTTGLLRVLLDSVESILPAQDKEGRAVALVSVVGGFIGAFNGFATYPVTIPGLVELGFDGVSAVTAYLVYFSWSVPFVSLFIAANISNAATHLPVADIARIIGLLSVPLVFISLVGFFKILKFRFFARETQTLLWLLWLGNVAAQVWPALYILSLIVGACFSLGLLYIFGKLAKRWSFVDATIAATASPGRAVQAPTIHSWPNICKAYAPLVLGVLLVIATALPGTGKAFDYLSFSVAAWGYKPIAINVFTSAGFFVLVTAFCCYPFRAKPANPTKDLIVASKRSASSVATLFVGSAMVYLMVDSGQIALLGKTLSSNGTAIYAMLNPFLSFLGGMAFGQGLPGVFLFAQMQIAVAPELGIPLILLVGIVTVVAMGPPNPLKPALIRYTASLANVTGRDSEIFRITLPWQLLQVVVTAIFSFILVMA
jgi:lactate permease